jgi:hypothetical protein
MVDVPDRSHIHVRLRPLKLALGHVMPPNFGLS